MLFKALWNGSDIDSFWKTLGILQKKTISVYVFMNYEIKKEETDWYPRQTQK